MNWKNNDAPLRRMMRNLESLGSKEIQVGVFGGQDDNGVPLPNIMMWNENGTPRIPARPFIRNGFYDNISNSSYKTSYRNLLVNVCNGTTSPAAALNGLGAGLEFSMKAAIEDGSRYTANDKKWAAYKAKVTGGFKSPLTFTGRMQDAVTYKIKPSGGI